MDLLTAAHPESPALDMALTAVILEAVSRGDVPETLRVFRPGPTVAFGRMDRHSPGFPDAVQAAVSHGRTPLVRLGGGRAAAYDTDCILVELVRTHERIGAGIEERFRDLADLLRDALDRCSVQTELGELRGEYCPGRFSLHLPGGPKVAGIAQRIVSRASLTTGVLVLDGGPALRATIADVYDALGLQVDPAIAGAVADRHPTIAAASVAAAVTSIVSERYRAVPATTALGLMSRAQELIPALVG